MMSRATATSAFTEVVSAADLAAIRDVVYGRAGDAAERAKELQERLRELSARVELLASLAESNVDEDGARARVGDAVSAVQALEPQDPETQLDVAIALLVGDRAGEAAKLVFEGLRVAASGAVEPAAFMTLLDRLLDPRWRAEADELLQSLLHLLAMNAMDVGRGAQGVPPARRRMFKDALRIVERHLESQPDDGVLRTFHAAALVAAGDTEDGVALIDKILAEGDADETARWVRIVARIRSGDQEDALRELERLECERPLAAALRVRLLTRLGREEDALAVTSRDPGAADDLQFGIARAHAFAAAGRTSDGLAVLDHLAERHPDTPEPLISRAEILLGMERTEEAIETLAELIGGDGSDVDAHALLARAYDQRGDSVLALAEVEVALDARPQRADLLLLRAQLLSEEDHVVEALHSLQAALQNGADGPGIAAFRGELLQRLRRYCEAQSACLEAIETGDPEQLVDYARAIVTMASELISDGSYLVALEGLDALRDRDLLSDMGLGYRAEVLRLVDRPLDAIEQADAAIAAGVDEAWMRGTKGACLVVLSRSEEALEVLLPAIDHDPGYLFALGQRTMALAELTALTDALRVIEDHLAVAEGWQSWASLAHAQTLIGLGRSEDAASEVKPLLDGSPDDVDLLLTLAMAYHRLGELDKAVELIGRIANPQEALNASAMLELADLLARQGGAASAEARASYAFVASKAVVETRPRSGVEAGWASFRLADADAAIAAYEAAFAGARDPLLYERIRYSVLLALLTPGDRAERQLERTFELLAGLRDRASAHGVFAEGAHVIALLRADPKWAAHHETLETVRLLFEQHDH